MKRKQKTIVASLEVSLLDLIENLSSMDHDEVFDFMCTLDTSMADYEFTERLRDHLTAELAKEDAVV